MKGRTPESLRRAIAGWHRDLAWAGAVEVASWGASGLPAYAHEEGAGEERRLYTIAELRSTQELAEEGAAMRHCVASYARPCAAGRSSIWSLRMRIESGRVVRLATIEVRARDGTIVQVRRQANKLPTDRETTILERWGDSGGPRLAYWLAT